MNQERCDIILPTCGEGMLVRPCIESLIKCTKYPFRLIVVNDRAPAEAAEFLRDLLRSGRLDMVLIEPPERLGWVRAVNAGLERSSDSKYVCFQNDDTVFTDGWLEELVAVFEKDPGIGIANPEWEAPSGADIAAFAAGLKKYGGQTIDTDYCRGHSFFIRREVVDTLGGFDPAYIPAYYDDRDYSLKAIAAGYRCVKAKASFVAHIRNVSMTKAMNREAIASLMERNGRIFYGRWAYPLKVVFVLRDPKGVGDILRAVCMDQNKVIVITRPDAVVPYEHTNMKVMRFNSLIFTIAAVIFLASNRSRKLQKGVDFVVTDSERFAGVARACKALITADVVSGYDCAGLGKSVLPRIKEKKERSKHSDTR